MSLCIRGKILLENNKTYVQQMALQQENCVSLFPLEMDSNNFFFKCSQLHLRGCKKLQLAGQCVFFIFTFVQRKNQKKTGFDLISCLSINNAVWSKNNKLNEDRDS